MSTAAFSMAEIGLAGFARIGTKAASSPRISVSSAAAVSRREAVVGAALMVWRVDWSSFSSAFVATILVLMPDNLRNVKQVVT